MEEFHELDEELNGILNCFKLLITSDIVKSPKPNTESMEYLCNALQLSKEDIIYIGDSETDKVFSQNCNISFIPACWENTELEDEDTIKVLNDYNVKYYLTRNGSITVLSDGNDIVIKQ